MYISCAYKHVFAKHFWPNVLGYIFLKSANNMLFLIYYLSFHKRNKFFVDKHLNSVSYIGLLVLENIYVNSPIIVHLYRSG